MRIAIQSLVIFCVSCLLVISSHLLRSNRRFRLPTDNPVARYRLDWVAGIPWSRVVNVREFAGQTHHERLEKAQEYLALRGGGVVYFPSGVYRFREDVRIRDGIILRGPDPALPDATHVNYYPHARFEFPRYVPSFHGNGAPVNTAFKIVRLADPARASNCGLVNIGINRARVVLGTGPGRRAGDNRLVFGCVVTNAAAPSSRVPDRRLGQQSWQRFPDSEAPAIHIATARNGLIANCKLPEGRPDNFTMDRYRLRDHDGAFRVVNGIPFDMNYRVGIRLDIDRSAAWTSHPAKPGKVMIRDNDILTTGPVAIESPPEGVTVTNNTIRRLKRSSLTENGVDMVTSRR